MIDAVQGDDNGGTIAAAVIVPLVVVGAGGALIGFILFKRKYGTKSLKRPNFALLAFGSDANVPPETMTPERKEALAKLEAV